MKIVQVNTTLYKWIKLFFSKSESVLTAARDMKSKKHLKASKIRVSFSQTVERAVSTLTLSFKTATSENRPKGQS